MSALSGIFTLNKLLDDLRSVANEVASTALIERGAGWIEQLRIEYPLGYQLLMNVLYREPRDVLEGLIAMNRDLVPLRGNQNVLAYIAQLQAALKRRKQS